MKLGVTAVTMPSTGNTHQTAGVVPDQRAALRQMSTEQLRHLGMRQVIYVRCGSRHGQPVFVLHGADGTVFMAVDTVDTAREAAVEHGLDFVAVH
jgi:hypothetical protein